MTMVSLDHDSAILNARFSYRVALAVLTIMVVVPSIVWIVYDDSVWMWDQAAYGEVASDLWRTLANNPKEWPDALIAALASKPPLLPWIGQFFVPIGNAIGKVETGLLFSNIAFNVVTMAAVASACRRFETRTVFISAIAVLAVAASPLFIGLVGQYVVEPSQTAIVALLWLLAVRASELPGRQIVWLGAALICAGFQCKTTTPLYTIAPGLLTLTALVGKRDWLARPRLTEIVIAAGTAPLVAITAFWYARNLPHVIQHVKDASTNDVALDYGWIGSFSSKFWTWVELFQQGFLTQPVSIAAGTLLLAAMARLVLRFPLRKEDQRAAILLGLAAGQILVVLALFALNIVVDARYLDPLVPAFAIGIAVICSLLPSFAGAILGAMLIGQFVWVQMISFGVMSHSSLVTLWVRKIERDPMNKNIMKAVITTTCGSPDDAGRQNMIGVEYPEMNANSAAFYSAVRATQVGWRCQYASVGYAAKDIGVVMSRLRDLHINYFVSVPAKYQQPVNFLNRVSNEVLERIAADKDYKQIPINVTNKVIIFHSESPQSSR